MNGNWTEWTNWTICNVTCGDGQQKRMRTCTNPVPREGGNPCIGVSLETEECHTNSCAGNVHNFDTNGKHEGENVVD